MLICPLLTPQSTHSRLQEFFGEYFEKQLLVIRREQADYYDDVYSIFDVESTARRSVILCHCCPFTPVISCVVQAVALAIHLSRNSHPQKAWSRRVNVVCMTPLQRLLSVRYRCIESEGEFMLKKDGHDLRNSDRAPPDCFAGYTAALRLDWSLLASPQSLRDVAAALCVVVPGRLLNDVVTDI